MRRRARIRRLPKKRPPMTVGAVGRLLPDSCLDPMSNLTYSEATCAERKPSGLAARRDQDAALFGSGTDRGRDVAPPTPGGVVSGSAPIAANAASLTPLPRSADTGRCPTRAG